MDPMNPGYSPAGGAGASGAADSHARPQSDAGFDKIKQAAATTLQTVAESLRNRSEGTMGQLNAVTDYGRHASELLDRSATYIQDLDMAKVQHDVEEMVRRNPGRSLLVAGTAGFLLGALLRRR